QWQGVPACVGFLKEQGYRVLATDLEASHSIDEIDFTQKTALVFGNERDGISDEMHALADGTVRIPMLGFAQSFNISVAAALCFQYVLQDRIRRRGSQGDLTERERTILRAAY